MMGPLLKMIDAYDREREAYIDLLEAKLAEAREQNNRLTDLMMAATAANERKTLQLILAGHFDNLVKKEGATTP